MKPNTECDDSFCRARQREFQEAESKKPKVEVSVPGFRTGILHHSKLDADPGDVPAHETILIRLAVLTNRRNIYASRLLPLKRRL